jgi:hypothetical protein
MDITLCTNAGCDVRNKCFRYRAEWGKRQSVAHFEGGKECPHFMSLDEEEVAMTTVAADKRVGDFILSSEHLRVRDLMVGAAVGLLEPRKPETDEGDVTS